MTDNGDAGAGKLQPLGRSFQLRQRISGLGT
jgi:hypothetical protein